MTKERKPSLILFIFKLISVIVGTMFTFYLLYRKTEDKTLQSIIFVVLLIYLFAFLIITLMSLPNRKISKDAMAGFKRYKKATKRILTLTILVLSVFNLVKSVGSGVDITLSILLIIYNLILMYVDVKINEIADKLERRRKRKEREKREKELREYRIDSKNSD